MAVALIKEGLVDEYGLYYVPVIAGGGTPLFGGLERRLDLQLIDERSFRSGVRFLRYAPRA